MLSFMMIFVSLSSTALPLQSLLQLLAHSMCSSQSTELYYAAIAVIVVTSLIYCRRYIRGTRFEENVRADGKIVAVTGANSGIGQAITAELNRRGATVYMLIRDKQRGLESISRLAKEGCDPNRLILRHVDLACFSSVRSFVEEFCKEVPRLDILICNAGVLWVPTFTKTADGFEKTWQCNYLGHFLLTQLLLPLICKSSDGRIINVSSILHEFADSVSFDVVNDPNRYGGMMAYSRSKMAQVMYTWYLARLLERKSLPVTVTVCHPGNVDTNILKESGFQWVRVVFRPLMWFVLKTQDDGAQMPLFLALSENLQNSNGHYF
ncbi:Glucose dehydrogenase, partial [Trichostrongylus colubriformis]